MLDEKKFDYYMSLDYPVKMGFDDEYQVFTAEVPALPGLKVYGDTVAEALTELEDAKASWISSTLDHGLEVPKP